MINLGFFPSRHLAFYMVRLFLTRSLAVLFALVLVLMTLDLLGEAGKILAVPGNGDSALWHYVALRIPLLISRFLPFSVLLGTLIAFVGLNQHSEVVAMKAAGLSAHQILAPLIVASIAIRLDRAVTAVDRKHLRADPGDYLHRFADLRSLLDLVMEDVGVIGAILADARQLREVARRFRIGQQSDARPRLGAMVLAIRVCRAWLCRRLGLVDRRQRFRHEFAGPVAIGRRGRRPHEAMGATVRCRMSAAFAAK